MKKKKLFVFVLAIALILNTVDLSAVAAAAAAANVAEVTIDGETTQYTNIDKAFTAAEEADSATVKLLEDVTIPGGGYNYGIELNKGTITLDLNGKTIARRTGIQAISSNYSCFSVFYLNGEGLTLTIQDTSSEQSGRIVQPDGFPAVLVKNGASLTVTSGTIQNTSSEDYRGTNSSASELNCAVMNCWDSYTTINGGTLTGKRGVVVNTNSNKGQLTITGGTISGTDGNALLAYYASRVTLSGGSFSTKSNTHSIWVNQSGKVETMLAEKCSYVQEDGTASKYSEDSKGVVGNTIVKAPVRQEVQYVDATGTVVTQNEFTEITADTAKLRDGWYVVKGDDVCRRLNASVSGTVNLILCDGAEWNLLSGLRMGNDATLNIYAQSAGTGKLTATGQGKTPAIGMDTGKSGGTLHIYGGVITAASDIPESQDGEVSVSEDRGAAIGTCGDSSNSDMTVYIYGGTVTAEATYGAAAIGKGQAATGTVTVTIASGMKCVKTDDLTAKAAYGNTEGDSVTISKCEPHSWEYNPNADTHTATCALCDTVGTTEAHSFRDWTDNDDGTHTGTCEDCKAVKTESHTPTFTPNADGLTHSGGCSKCGYEIGTENHDFNQTDKYGKKCACDEYLVAEYNGQQYAALTSAIEAAKNGGTVTLQKAVVAENITITDGMNVTIDLNNNEWTHINENGNRPALTMRSGSATVKNGTLETYSGATASTAVEINGGSLIVGDGMTINGAMGDVDLYRPAIEVHGGDLKLSAGTKLGYGMSVSATGKTLADYLPEGAAFQQTDYGERGSLTDTSNIINGYVQEKVGKFKLTVVAHEHSFTEEDGSYVCECGYACSDHHFENGTCTVCGYECPHTAVAEENGITTCNICKEQMAVKVTSGGKDTYYAATSDRFGCDDTLNQVFAKVPDGSTITLLEDNLQAFAFVTGGKTITLNLNGRTLIENNGITVYDDSADNKLIVTGEGYSQTDNVFCCTFRVADGNLKFDDDFGGKFGSVYVGGGTLTSVSEARDAIEIGTLLIYGSNNAKISFKRGGFGEIEVSENRNVKLGDLLEEESGYAFRHTTGDKGFVPYNTEITSSNGVKNVTVVKCDHSSLDKENTCNYCGMEHIVAMCTADDGTIETICSATWAEADINTAANKALDTWNSMGGTLRLFADFALEDIRCNCQSGKRVSLDLNGHKVTGELTLEGVRILTITDSTAGKEGSFGNITVKEGAGLVLDGVKAGWITAADKISRIALEEGTRFTEYDLPGWVALSSWIDDGYCIMDGKNPVLINVTASNGVHGTAQQDIYTVTKAPVTITADNKSGELPYGEKVPASFLPKITPTDSTAAEDYCEITWYRRTDTGTRFLGSGTLRDGTFEYRSGSTDFSGLSLGDKLDVFCCICGYKDASDSSQVPECLWETVVRGYKLTVVKGTAAVEEAPVAVADLVYNGSAQELVTAGTANNGTLQYSLEQNGTYSNDIPVGTDAKEYTVWYKVVAGDENCNDSEPASVKVTIAPEELTMTGSVLAVDRVYVPGDTTVILRGDTLALHGLIETETVRVSVCEGTVADADAGENKDVTYMPVLTDGENGGKALNYTISKVPAVTVNITKAVLSGVEEESRSYVYAKGSGRNRESVDIPGKLPADRGNTTYTLVTEDKDELLSGVTVDGDGKLSYKVKQLEAAKVGTTAAIKVTVSMKNYEDVVYTMMIKIVDKKRVALTSGAAVSVEESSALIYGDKLSKLTLGSAVFVEDGTDEVVEGTLSWVTPDKIPAVGSTEADWIFTPNDSDLYTGLSGKTAIIVVKAAKAPNMPENTMTTAHSTAKVGDIALPEGWSWQDTDKDKALADETPVTATAVYIGADKGNYETESVTISIIRDACEHKHTEIRDQKEAACVEKGYTGDTYCTDCNTLLSAGNETAELRHDYKAKITRQPTTTEEGIRTYTCSRCHDTYTESIAKLTTPETPSPTPSNPVTPSEPSTPSQTPGDSDAPNPTPSSPAVPSLAPGTTETPSPTPSNPATPSNPSVPSSTPGDSPIPSNPALPSLAPGTTETPNPTPSNPAVPSLTPGTSETPSPAPSNPALPSEAPGTSETPNPVPGNPALPSEVPGTSKTPSPTPKPNGTKLQDSEGAAYIVTDAKGKTPTVQYAAPKKAARGIITIPATVTIGNVTYKVTSIGDNAFKNNKKITEVVIGSNIVSIGKNAFAGCKNLKTITIKSKKLTSKSIAKGAFSGISKKTVIKVPKSKYKTYKKLLRAKGLRKAVKIKRY